MLGKCRAPYEHRGGPPTPLWGPGEVSNEVTSWLHFYGKGRADQRKGEMGGRVKTEQGGGQRKEGMGQC